LPPIFCGKNPAKNTRTRNSALKIQITNVQPTAAEAKIYKRQVPPVSRHFGNAIEN